MNKYIEITTDVLALPASELSMMEKEKIRKKMVKLVYGMDGSGRSGYSLVLDLSPFSNTTKTESTYISDNYSDMAIMGFSADECIASIDSQKINEKIVLLSGYGERVPKIVKDFIEKEYGVAFD
jgi:hypothetical protein